MLEQVEKKTQNKKFIALVERCLSERELRVIRLRYGLGGGAPLPQREVASLLRISRSYISRIEKKAIEKIKEEIKRSDASFD